MSKPLKPTNKNIININRIRIKLCFPKYIEKDVKIKTGLFKNKTKTISKKTALNFDVMKDYPQYIIDKFKLNFENGYKSKESIPSIQYTLEIFCIKNPTCKIISVIREDNFNLCIIWEENV